jgi:putative ABC transport system substrate-binding protein
MDLIFASSTPAALAAKRTTTTIPIVIGNVGDPVGSGLVASLAHPGGNITGWTSLGLDLRGKYLELLKEAVPKATRIGVLRNPANPLQAATGPDLEAAARALKVQLHTVGSAILKSSETPSRRWPRRGSRLLSCYQTACF